MKALGIILVVLGILALAFPVIRLAWKEKVVEIGPVELAVKKHETVSFAPLLGVTFLAVGGAILVAGAITGKR